MALHFVFTESQQAASTVRSSPANKSPKDALQRQKNPLALEDTAARASLRPSSARAQRRRATSHYPLNRAGKLPDPSERHYYTARATRRGREIAARSRSCFRGTALGSTCWSSQTTVSRVRFAEDCKPIMQLHSSLCKIPCATLVF